MNDYSPWRARLVSGNNRAAGFEAYSVPTLAQAHPLGGCDRRGALLFLDYVLEFATIFPVSTCQGNSLQCKQQ